LRAKNKEGSRHHPPRREKEAGNRHGPGKENAGELRLSLVSLVEARGERGVEEKARVLLFLYVRRGEGKETSQEKVWRLCFCIVEQIREKKKEPMTLPLPQTGKRGGRGGGVVPNLQTVCRDNGRVRVIWLRMFHKKEE